MEDRLLLSEDAPRLKSRRRLAWGTFIAVTLIFAVGVGVGIASRSVDPFGILMFAFPLVGIFVLTRQPANRIGWILMAIGVIWATSGILTGYAEYGLRTNPGSVPGPDVADALSSPMWAPAFGVMGVYLLLLFPDGRLVSPGFRKVAWLGAIGIAGAWILLTVLPGNVDPGVLPNEANPLGIAALHGFEPIAFVFIALIPISIVASAVSLVRRFRRSEGTLRLQLKWLASAAAVVAVFYALAIGVSVGATAWAGPGTPAWIAVIQVVGVSSFVLIPIAVGIAILRYRLYEIDVVINKTLVYGSLAAFITAVYVAIVVGIGTAVGSKRNLGLSILATAVVAVGFQPVRDRVQHLANRLVYGKRATPYEVLSEFSERMSGSYATEDLLPRMARILAEGTGAIRADVWLHVGNTLHPEASWPSGSETPEPIAADDVELPTIEGIDRLLPVRHGEELLGALSVTKARGDPLRPAEEKLLEDLASGAGLVLRNVRLTAELLARLEELQASRQRIVAAQDEERRKLERNLHDGAQQQLVALQVRLSLAERLAEEDCRAKDQLASLKIEAGEALENLRDLARGIYPPLLADQGLAAALSSQARKATFPVSIEADRITRSAGPGGRGVLLRARGPAERRQVRRGHPCHHHPVGGRRPAHLRRHR